MRGARGRTMRALGAAVRVAVAGVATAGLAVVLAGCVGAGPGLGSTSTPTPTIDVDAFARELFALTNAEREDAGLAPLEWSGCLVAKAAERAAPLADGDALEHDVLVATCLEDAIAGENLSRSDRSAPGVVAAWMASEGHRANLLGPEYTISGVACVPAGEALVGCAQLFEGVAR